MNHFLVDPRLKNLPMGSSEWFLAQRGMIESKPLIKRCYDLWYECLLADEASVPGNAREGLIVELGSGSSYLKKIKPQVITSDMIPGVADTVIDGRALPFRDGSVRALFLTHVFHHIPDVSQFFREADRVLVPGGVISMVDCTHTPFARFFFSKFHPEVYDDKQQSWSFPPGDNMLDSNQALTWMVFWRDRQRFESEFPMFRLEQWRYLPWFSYLMSGGVNLRSFFPSFLAPVFPTLDRVLKRVDGFFAVHWHLTVRKI